MQIIKRFLELEWPNTVSLHDALTRLARHLQGYVLADRIYLVLRNPRTTLWHAFSSSGDVLAESQFGSHISPDLLLLAEKQPTGAIRTNKLYPQKTQFELSIPLWYADAFSLTPEFAGCLYFSRSREESIRFDSNDRLNAMECANGVQALLVLIESASLQRFGHGFRPSDSFLSKYTLLISKAKEHGGSDSIMARDPELLQMFDPCGTGVDIRRIIRSHLDVMEIDLGNYRQSSIVRPSLETIVQTIANHGRFRTALRVLGVTEKALSARVKRLTGMHINQFLWSAGIQPPDLRPPRKPRSLS